MGNSEIRSWGTRLPTTIPLWAVIGALVLAMTASVWPLNEERHIFSPTLEPFGDASFRDLQGVNLAGQDLRGVNLAGSNLMRANLTGANLEDAILTGANLSFASLTEAFLERAVLNGAIAFETDFSGAFAAGTDFQSANLSSARFVNADLWQANMSYTKIDGAEFDNAHLSEVDWTKTQPGKP